MIRAPRLAAVLAAAVAVLLLVAIFVIHPFGRAQAASTPATPTASAPIVRTNIVERQQVTGTLDYSGSFTVANSGSAGVVTWLPSPGTIVRRGRPLYELDHASIRLLYGARPAYRDLALGISDGGDIRELQQNLRTLGFNAGRALTVSGRFGPATLVAVEQWQRSLGQPPTGDLPLGSIVFLPDAARVSSLNAIVGATVQAGAPILSATSIAPAVLVPLDPGSVSQLRVGDPVLVTMPDSTTAHGKVASIGRVATVSNSSNGQSPSTPTVPVTISLDDPHAARGLDQAPVQVAITAQEDRHVLAAPISALQAQPGGGYAVTVVDGATTRLITVTTGLFDDIAGRVEISGPGLAAGMVVQVPSG